MKNWEKYWFAKREAKKIVEKVRSKAFEGFYKALEIKNWE